MTKTVLIKQALAAYPYLNASLAVFVLFFAMFVGTLFWVMKRRNKGVYSYAEMIPLTED